MLVPADAEAAGPGDLVNLLVHAARGDGNVHDLVLRPDGRIRHPYWARGRAVRARRALALMRLG